jgi:phage terminase large subunit-like protein
MPSKPMFDLSSAFETVATELSKQAVHPDRLGYKPHSKQVAFHKSDDYIRLYLGGNRAGKTHGGVMEDLYWVLNCHPYLVTPPPPVNIRVVCPSFNDGFEEVLLPKYKALIRPSDYYGGDWEKAYNRALRRITFKNGSTIRFMSYEQDVQKFSGASLHAIHFDEEPPKDIYNECAARVVDTGGRMWITMTPVDGITWVYDELYEPVKEASDREDIVLQTKEVGPVYRSAKKEVTVVEVGMNENPYLDTKARDRFLNSLEDKDERAARSHGQFVAVGGKVFPEFGSDTHVIDPVSSPSAYFRDWTIYTSVDHGWNNPTAWLWHAVSPDGVIITFMEHYKAQMTIPEHASAVHQLEKAFKINPEFRVGDPALKQTQAVTGVSVLGEYALRGLHINVEGIPRDPQIGIAKMHQYFKLRGEVRDSTTGTLLSPGQPSWYVTENCPNFIKELKNLTFQKYESAKLRYKHNKKEQVQKKNDHAFDSAKYFATFMPDLTPDTKMQAADESLRTLLAANGVVLPYTGATLQYDKALYKEAVEKEDNQQTGWTVLEEYV